MGKTDVKRRKIEEVYGTKIFNEIGFILIVVIQNGIKVEACKFNRNFIWKHYARYNIIFLVLSLF